MKIIAGLGNPGDNYVNSRHNIGFMVLDFLNQDNRWSKSKNSKFVYSKKIISGKSVELIKPQTFMNNSGLAVGEVIKKHKGFSTKDLCVIHDDLDITLGKWKIDFGKGPKEHNGILSIEETLKTKDFWRIRVGVDNRTVENRIPGESYVLQKFSKNELQIIENLMPEIRQKLLEKI